MAKTNTEKPTGKAESKKKVVKAPKKQKIETPKETKPKEEKKPETKAEEKSKQPVVKKPLKKKTEALIIGKNLPISTKYSASICRFIKNKEIENAIKELEDVLAKKRAVPMKGEYAHKKGKGKVASGSAKYPKKATEYFIRMLKSLQANANYNEIDNPMIFEAIANIGERPYGRFGTVRRKRTHLVIKARNKKMEKKYGRKRRS